MTLYAKIQAEMKQAMKDKDSLKVNTLRAVVAAAKNYLVSSEKARKKGITDEVLLDLIMKEAKKREESIQAYKKAKRDDLAAEEEAELKILKAFLPEMMSEEEIRELALKVIDSVGAKGPSDLGKIMREIMPKVKGRANGKTVNRIVRELLASK